jgi:hypothetical protein
MSSQRCRFCGAALYGRSDKQYCSATCRRDASRVRERTIRLGDYTLFGRERSDSELEAILIPQLEREYGPNHRVVRLARQRAEELREAEMQERLRRFRNFSWGEETRPEGHTLGDEGA